MKFAEIILSADGQRARVWVDNPKLATLRTLAFSLAVSIRTALDDLGITPIIEDEKDCDRMTITLRGDNVDVESTCACELFTRIAEECFGHKED